MSRDVAGRRLFLWWVHVLITRELTIIAARSPPHHRQQSARTLRATTGWTACAERSGAGQSNLDLNDLRPRRMRPMTLTLNPQRAVVKTRSHAKYQGRSLEGQISLKTRVDTDGRTRPTALSSPLTESVEMYAYCTSAFKLADGTPSPQVSVVAPNYSAAIRGSEQSDVIAGSYVTRTFADVVLSCDLPE